MLSFLYATNLSHSWLVSFDNAPHQIDKLKIYMREQTFSAMTDYDEKEPRVEGRSAFTQVLFCSHEKTHLQSVTSVLLRTFESSDL